MGNKRKILCKVELGKRAQFLFYFFIWVVVFRFNRVHRLLRTRSLYSAGQYDSSQTKLVFVMF